MIYRFFQQIYLHKMKVQQPLTPIKQKESFIQLNPSFIRITLLPKMILFYILILTQIHHADTKCSIRKNIAGANNYTSNVAQILLTQDNKRFYTIDNANSIVKYWQVTANNSLIFKQSFSGIDTYYYLYRQMTVCNYGQKLILGGRTGLRIYNFNSTKQLYDTTPELNMNIGATYYISSVWVNSQCNRVYIAVNDTTPVGRIGRINFTNSAWTSFQLLTNIKNTTIWKTISNIKLSDDQQRLTFYQIGSSCGYFSFKYNGTFYNQVSTCPFEDSTTISTYSWISRDLKYICATGNDKAMRCYLEKSDGSYQNISVASTVPTPNLPYDPNIDDNQIYTFIEFNSMKFYRYNFTMVGSTPSYTLLQSYDTTQMVQPYHFQVSNNSMKNTLFYLFTTIGGEIMMVDCSCTSYNTGLLNCADCPYGLCLSCKSGFLFNNGDCLQCLPKHFNNSGNCSPCGINCQVCVSATNCTTCTTGFNGTTGICSTCSTGYYNNSNICSACAGRCDICINATNCTTCSVGYRLNNSACTLCATGYWNNSNVCTACSSRCDQCTNSSICTLCSTGYKLTSGACSSCDVGYFNSSNVCTKCQVNCNICTSTTACTNCSGSYSLISSSCCTAGTLTCNDGSISASCNSGYYQSNQSCLACSSGCSTCTNSTICTVCFTGYRLNNSACNSCATGYWNNSNTCTACSSRCDVCSNSSVCTVCSAGYKLTSGACTTCNVGYFNSSNVCTKCQLNCDTCSSASVCTNCSSSYSLISSSCCKPGTLTCNDGGISINCNLGYYLINQTCLACGTNCLNCSNSLNCLMCSAGYKLTNGLCNVCDVSYFNISNVCVKCSNYCDVCTNISACITCTTGFIYITGSCCSPGTINCQNGTSTNCSIGYFLNGGRCQACQSNLFCKSCSNSRSCISCLGNYYFDNGLCFLCQNGYADQQGTGCLSCLQRCQLCNDASSCITCQAGYQSDGDSPCSKCSLGYYNSSGVCTSCRPGCSECLNSDSHCTKCQPFGEDKYYLFANSCIQNCPTNYTAVDATFICSCPVFSVQGACLLDCENGTYVDVNTSQLTCRNQSIFTKIQTVSLKTKLIKSGERMEHKMHLSEGMPSKLSQESVKSQILVYIVAYKKTRLLQNLQQQYNTTHQLTVYDVKFSSNRINIYVQTQNGLQKISDMNQALIMVKFTNSSTLITDSGTKYNLYSQAFPLSNPVFQHSYYMIYQNKIEILLAGMVVCVLAFVLLVVVILMRYQYAFNEVMALILTIQCLALFRMKEYPIDISKYGVLLGFSQYQFTYVPNYIMRYFQIQYQIKDTIPSIQFTLGSNYNLFDYLGGYFIISVVILFLLAVSKIIRLIWSSRRQQANATKTYLIFQAITNICLPKIILSVIILTYVFVKNNGGTKFTFEFWISLAIGLALVAAYLIYFMVWVRKNLKKEFYKIHNFIRVEAIFAMILNPLGFGIIFFNTVEGILSLINFYFFRKQKLSQIIFFLQIVLTFGVFNIAYYLQYSNGIRYFQMGLGGAFLFMIFMRLILIRLQYWFRKQSLNQTQLHKVSSQIKLNHLKYQAKNNSLNDSSNYIIDGRRPAILQNYRNKNKIYNSSNISPYQNPNYPLTNSYGNEYDKTTDESIYPVESKKRFVNKRRKPRQQRHVENMFIDNSNSSNYAINQYGYAGYGNNNSFGNNNNRSKQYINQSVEESSVSEF